jgi:hypothetical protein
MARLIPRWFGCWRHRTALVDLVEGTLGGPRRARVERHVARCPSCAAQRLRLERARELLRAPSFLGEEAFFQRQRQAILARAAAFARPLPDTGASLPVRPPARPFPWSAAFAAVLAAVIATIGLERFHATFRPRLQLAGDGLEPVPNDVDALEPQVLLELAGLAEAVAPPVLDVPHVEALAVSELDAIDSWLGVRLEEETRG